MPRLEIRALWSPKEGLTPWDWEDACAFSEGRGLLAVSDGASSSYRAHEWAAALVEGFVEAPPRPLEATRVHDWLQERARAWGNGPTPGGNAAWYVEEAASRGSFATFLGIEVSMTPWKWRSAEWRACAVGDTCLFHVRDAQLLTAFPVDDPNRFNSTPPLLASEPRFAPPGLAALQILEGSCRPGDLLLIATDALAAWALRAASEDSRVWSVLAGIPAARFADLVQALRGAHSMENDDVTLLRCHIL